MCLSTVTYPHRNINGEPVGLGFKWSQDDKLPSHKFRGIYRPFPNVWYACDDVELPSEDFTELLGRNWYHSGFHIFLHHKDAFNYQRFTDKTRVFLVEYMGIKHIGHQTLYGSCSQAPCIIAEKIRYIGINDLHSHGQFHDLVTNEVIARFRYA